MIFAKVMDNTGEAKLLLFDSICSEIIGESATSVLDGSVDEVCATIFIQSFILVFTKSITVLTYTMLCRLMIMRICLIRLRILSGRHFSFWSGLREQTSLMEKKSTRFQRFFRRMDYLRNNCWRNLLTLSMLPQLYLVIR